MGLHSENSMPTDSGHRTPLSLKLNSCLRSRFGVFQLALFVMMTMISVPRHIYSLKCFAGDPLYQHECTSLSYCLHINSRYVLQIKKLNNSPIFAGSKNRVPSTHPALTHLKLLWMAITCESIMYLIEIAETRNRLCSSGIWSWILDLAKIFNGQFFGLI